MKRILFVVAVAVMSSFATVTNAQNYKFGHIDSGMLLQQMPEREQARVQLEKYAKQLEDQMAAMQSEFETKYQQYLEQRDSLPQVLLEAKERELTDIQQRFQVFQETARKDLSAKEGELLQPIIDKAKKAIDDVAAENGFIYVFDISTGAILYNSDQSVDLMPLVLKKLGVK
jgi:outer membrane protein